MLDLLKKSIKESNIQEACQTLKITGVAINSQIISFRFLNTSEQLRKTKVCWSEAEKLVVTVENFVLSIVSKRKVL